MRVITSLTIMVLLFGFLAAPLTSISAQAPTFYLTVSPSSQNVRQGQLAYFQVKVLSVYGFEQPVTLSTTGLTTGLTPSYDPTSVTPPKDGSASSTLTVLVSSGLATTDYTFYVTASGGGITQQSSLLTLKVFLSSAADFTMYVVSASVTVGSYVTSTVTVTQVNAFIGTITFTIPDPPLGLTVVSFSPTSVRLGYAGTTNQSILMLQAGSTMTGGTYYIAITGTGGAPALTKVGILTLTVVVLDFTIGADPTSRSIKQGQSAEYTLTIGSTGGFAGTVLLTKSWVTATPSGIDTDLEATSVSLTAYGSQQVKLTATATSTATTGTHKLRVTGTSGTKTHSVDVQLTVSTGANFTLSVQPASQTVNRGASQTFTVTVTSIGAFNKPVYLSLSGHQTGITYDFNPNPITPPVGASVISTLTVYASSTASLETRTLTITASAPDPGITHTATVSLTVAGKTDTTISCSISVATIKQGQNMTISGSITPNPGANNNVTLEYSTDGGSTWGTITTVKTDSSGGFSYVWSPSQGNYKVRSRWGGSAIYNGATSSQQSLTVQPPGCIIATATYGSELSPEVQFLRAFRDGTAMSTFAGSGFMKVFNAWYYSFSPNVADFISKQPPLKEAMKALLYPLVGILHISALTYSALSFNPELAIVAAGILASGLIGIIYLAPLSLIALLCMKRHRKFRLNPSQLKGLTAIWIASIALICLAEVTATQTIMMGATAMLVLSTLTLTGLTTTQRIIQKLT